MEDWLNGNDAVGSNPLDCGRSVGEVGPTLPAPVDGGVVRGREAGRKQVEALAATPSIDLDLAAALVTEQIARNLPVERCATPESNWVGAGLAGTHADIDIDTDIDFVREGKAASGVQQ